MSEADQILVPYRIISGDEIEDRNTKTQQSRARKVIQRLEEIAVTNGYISNKQRILTLEYRDRLTYSIRALRHWSDQTTNQWQLPSPRTRDHMNYHSVPSMKSMLRKEEMIVHYKLIVSSHIATITYSVHHSECSTITSKLPSYQRLTVAFN